MFEVLEVSRARLAWRALALACLAFALMVASAGAATTSVSSFTKSGRDLQNGSTASAGGAAGTTGAGHTLQWVLSYRNRTGSTADVNITDPIAGNQSYVRGSLKAPPEFTRQWSTNGGSSYTTSEPGSGVNAVGATGTSIDGSTGLQDLFSPPLQSFRAGNTGGDGWEAMFIGGNIYNVFHHFGPGPQTNELDCHVKTTGDECAGFPVGYVSPNAGDPFGTGPDVLTSANANNGAYNPSTGEIFWASGIAGSTSIGVACANVLTMQSCGYTQLATAEIPNVGVNGGGAPGMQGGKQVGNQYYTVASGIDGDPVFCFDMTTHAACAGWPAGGVPSDPGNTLAIANPDVNGNSAALESWGGYLFTAVYQGGIVGNPVDVGCIVIATQSRCPGFPKVGAVTAVPMAPLLDSGGNLTGVCAEDATLGAGAYECFSVTTGTSLGSAPWGTPVTGTSVITGVSPEVIGTRVYLPYRDTGGVSTYYCWDSSTNSACQGFVPVSSGQDVRVYTLRKDPQNPDCIWELGDAGVYEVFSATFGGSVGCKVGNAQVQVTPAAFYCDGSAGHVTGWNELRIHGVTASDYDAVAVTITDANGNPVPGWTNRIFQSSQVPIDISAIPYSGSTTSLKVQMVIDWASHPAVPDVTMDATFSGDAPQVCFQTKVGAASCPAAQTIQNSGKAVTTVAGGASDAPGGNSSGTAKFSLPPDASLCPHLTIDKRALQDKVTVGDPVTYLIVARNNGPVAAPDATIDDTVPAQLRVTSASSPQGPCSVSGNAIHCSVGTIAVGHEASVVVRTVAIGTGGPTNTASVSSSKCLKNPCDDDPANVTIVKPRLRLSKSVGRRVLHAGQTTTYRIRVRNPSAATLHQVQVCDRLPSGLVFVSAKPSASLKSGQQCWTLSTLAAHASKTFKLKVRALRGTSGKKVNNATATSPDAKTARAKRTVRVIRAAVLPADRVTG